MVWCVVDLCWVKNPLTPLALFWRRIERKGPLKRGRSSFEKSFEKDNSLSLSHMYHLNTNKIFFARSQKHLCFFYIFFIKHVRRQATILYVFLQQSFSFLLCLHMYMKTYIVDVEIRGDWGCYLMHQNDCLSPNPFKLKVTL